MSAKGHRTGMLGVYLVAAELTKRGFIVSPTSRSALGADLLVTDQRCRKAWSVQVKTNAKAPAFWLTGKKAQELVSPTHIYVFVNARTNTDKAPDFYVVPSGDVARAVKLEHSRTGSIWYPWYKDEKYRDKWDLFGDPE